MVKLSLAMSCLSFFLTACTTTFAAKDLAPRPGLYRAEYELYRQFMLAANRELWLGQYMVNEPLFGQLLIEKAQAGTQLVILAEENSNRNLCQSAFHVIKEHYPEYKALIEQGQTRDRIIASLCERKTEAALLASGRVRLGDFKDSSCEKCMLHGKAMILDPDQHDLVLISSGNLDPNSSGINGKTKARDFVVIRQDAAMSRVLRELIEADLAYDAPKAAAVAKEQTTDLTIGPYDTSEILDFVRSAKQSVTIENQYITEVGLLEILKELDAKGVEITLILQDPCSRGTIYGGETYSKFFAQPLKSVRAYAWTSDMNEDGKATTLHTKAILVDGERGWIGSNNFSKGGLGRHREFGIFLKSQEVEVLKGHMKAAEERLVAEEKDFKKVLFGKCRADATPDD